MKELKVLAIVGNVLFIMWLLFNGVDEHWSASPMQLVSYTTLIALLILNSVLIARRKGV